MRGIVIGGRKLKIKDYHCAQDDDYLDKPDGKLWLYVNLTDICNGRCPFCINPSVKDGKGNGSIRFYYRRMGEKKAPYARQLVYTADGRLLAGFSGKEIRFDK